MKKQVKRERMTALIRIDAGCECACEYREDGSAVREGVPGLLHQVQRALRGQHSHK